VPEIAREGVLHLSGHGIAREHMPIFSDADVSNEALIAQRKPYGAASLRTIF